MKLLEGKIAIITGGSRGIGEALVRKFVEHGAKVAFTYVSASSQARAEKLATELGDAAKAYQSDAGDFAQAEALVSQVVADFGKLDIVINNAGITRDTLMLRMTEQQWDEVIQTNLKSVFNMTKHALKPMIRTGGSIINMSSVVGVFGQQGQANYAASKAGARPSHSSPALCSLCGSRYSCLSCRVRYRGPHGPRNSGWGRALD